MEGKLTNNRTRWHGRVLRTNKTRQNPKDVLENKNKRKMPIKETKSKWEQWVRKDVTHNGGRKAGRTYEEIKEELWEHKIQQGIV